PQWLGPRRDGVWRETGILSRFPDKGLTARWRTPIAAGFAGPAVAKGRVVVMDRVAAKPTKAGKEGHERVCCLNAVDGKVLWKHEYDCAYDIDYPLGPRTTAVINESEVYTLGAVGHLFCFDLASGAIRWSHDLKKEYHAKSPTWGYAAHLLVDGHKL